MKSRHVFEPKNEIHEDTWFFPYDGVHYELAVKIGQKYEIRPKVSKSESKSQKLAEPKKSKFVVDFTRNAKKAIEGAGMKVSQKDQPKEPGQGKSEGSGEESEKEPKRLRRMTYYSDDATPREKRVYKK